MDRRQFLTSTTIGATGLGLSACAGISSLAGQRRACRPAVPALPACCQRSYPLFLP